ncbi:ubiquitin-specific protease doa4 [Coemansia sp. RSA 2322]|nr:ubiquitin-specific protease doa4 [Coemansia sp. RSA 2322]
MSKLGDGRTSDLIRRFESLALEKTTGGGPGSPKPGLKPPQLTKRLPVANSGLWPKQDAEFHSDSFAGINSDTSNREKPAAALSIGNSTQAPTAISEVSSVVPRSRNGNGVSSSSSPTQDLLDISGSISAAANGDIDRTAESQLKQSDVSRARSSTIESTGKASSGSQRRRRTLLTLLNERAAIDPSVQASSKVWLRSAERRVDEGRVCVESGDIENGYYNYMLACNIITERLPKQRDFETVVRKDAKFVRLGREFATTVLPEMERLAVELKKRPYVEPAASGSSQHLEKAAAEQIGRVQSEFAQMYPEVPPRPHGSGEEGAGEAASAAAGGHGGGWLASQMRQVEKLDAQARLIDSGAAAAAAVAVAGGGYVDTNTTTCTAGELCSLLDRSRIGSSERPLVLLLDVRPRQDYEWGRIDHRYTVNVDPLGLQKKYTSTEIEASLALVADEQQRWFRRRDEFDLIVYVCQSARSFGDSSSAEVSAVEFLNSAIYHYEYQKPLKHPPLFLIGGFDAWVQTVGASRCLWSEKARRAAGGGVVADSSSVLAFHATTGTLPAIRQPSHGAGGVAAGSLLDFFPQGDQQQQQLKIQQAAVESGDRLVTTHTSYTQGFNFSATGGGGGGGGGGGAVAAFDNPIYGFTGPTAAHSQAAGEYPAVTSIQAAPLHPVAVRSSAAGEEQPKRRRDPPPIPPPVVPHSATSEEQSRGRRDPPPVPQMPLPPKPAAYVQEQQGFHHQQPQGGFYQHPPPAESLFRQPPAPNVFYRQPAAAGSDPTLNGRMRAGGHLRSAAGMAAHEPTLPSSPGDPFAESPGGASEPAAYGATGLKNFGNTCFMNCVVQCLAGTGPFARYFLRGVWKRDLVRSAGARGDVAVEFARLVHAMWRGQYASLSPIAFRTAVGTCSARFRGTDQEDAHEFASFLLDALHEALNCAAAPHEAVRAMTADEERLFELLPDAQQAEMQWGRSMRRNWSIATGVFQGQAQSRLMCLTCKHTSTTYFNFTELSVPVPAAGPAAGATALVRKGSIRHKQQAESIYQCLDAYAEAEVLDGDNRWLCPRCNAKRRATKRLLVSRLPLVLIVHLKRFSTIGHFREKLETNVTFPTHALAMDRYVVPDVRHAAPAAYNLYAVANHFGSLSGGHYTASVFNGFRQEWSYFDDTRVSPILESHVATPAAYLLFFVQSSPST